MGAESKDAPAPKMTNNIWRSISDGYAARQEPVLTRAVRVSGLRLFLLELLVPHAWNVPQRTRGRSVPSIWLQCRGSGGLLAEADYVSCRRVAGILRCSESKYRCHFSRTCASLWP